MSTPMPPAPESRADTPRRRARLRFRRGNESVLIVGGRRIPSRVLLVSTAVVWVAFIVTLIIVLMLWLYLTCYLILLGAEINAEAG